MNDSGLFKNIRDFYDKYIDNKFVRFVLLIGAGGFGLLFGKLADVQFFRDYLGLHETVAEYLATAVVGIFVFILLWYFRTRDVRQQIEKTQEQIDKFQIQIWQNQFNDAIGNLSTDDNMVKEEVGVKSLIKLSTVVPEFNKLIIIAFENKIEELQITIHKYNERTLNWSVGDIPMIKNPENPKYMYRIILIKDIKKWLSDHKKPGGE